MEKDLVLETNTSYECNICYESLDTSNEIIILECCKGTKKICIYCINYLTTPICPYCRCELPSECLLYLKEQNNISISEPNTSMLSWENFLEEENIINPYIYEDSRRLRRQIRRLRHEYRQRRTRRNENNVNIQSGHLNHTNQRQSLQNYANYVMNQYNHNRNLYNELFIMDDC